MCSPAKAGAVAAVQDMATAPASAGEHARINRARNIPLARQPPQQVQKPADRLAHPP